MSEYSCESIEVLTVMQAVRKRPGMYVGDTTNGSGLHQLLWQAVDDVIDQHIAGYASVLKVELSPDGWICVGDDAPGIPTDLMPGRSGEADSPFLEVLFTQLLAGRALWQHAYRVAGGLHGVGIAAVNALCERLAVETTYQGVRWTQSFERGERTAPLRRLGPSTVEGTSIRFRPDATIFGSIELDRGAVLRRLEELAWLHPHLRVWFQEQRLSPRGGIGEWTRQLATERGELVDTMRMRHQVRDVRVDVAFAWNRGGPMLLRAFVNTNATPRGSHLEGLWLGLTEYARVNKSPAQSVAHVREAIGTGLVAIVDVAMMDPRYTSQTREQLDAPHAIRAVRAAVLGSLHSDHCETWRARRVLEKRLLLPRDQ